jgi:hypothetical protein
MMWNDFSSLFFCSAIHAMRQSIMYAGAYEGEANQLLREYSGWLQFDLTPFYWRVTLVQEMLNKRLQRGSLHEVTVLEEEV